LTDPGGGLVVQFESQIGPTDTHYEATVDGLTVISDVSYDSLNDWNTFYYHVENETGDTIFQAKYFGTDWIAGGGGNQVWSHEVVDLDPIVDPNAEFIRFYDKLLDNNNVEDFISVTGETEKVAIGDAEFKSIEGRTFSVPVLKPTNIPEPSTLALMLLGSGLLAKKRR